MTAAARVTFPNPTRVTVNGADITEHVTGIQIGMADEGGSEVEIDASPDFVEILMDAFAAWQRLRAGLITDSPRFITCDQGVGCGLRRDHDGFCEIVPLSGNLLRPVRRQHEFQQDPGETARLCEWRELGTAAYEPCGMWPEHHAHYRSGGACVCSGCMPDDSQFGVLSSYSLGDVQ